MTRALRVVGNGVRGLTRNRVRTFFMMLGTFVGVGALTMMLAMGRNAQREVTRQVNRMLSGNTIFLRAGGGQMRAGAHGSGPTTTLTLGDLRAIDSLVDAVDQVDPLLMAGRRDVTHEGKSAQISVTGHSEAAERVWNRSVTRGAYFTSGDVAGAARVALVGEVVVRELFEGRDPIGAQIRIGTVPFQVIGVLEPVGIDPHGSDRDNEIIIPISTMMRRVLNVDYVQGAKLAARDGADLEGIVRDVEGILRQRHAIGPDQLDDFAMFTPIQVQQMVRGANSTFTRFLPLVSGLSIVIGALVVANLMLMTVHERSAEIGLRRAVGARSADIRLQFLAESAAVTGLGGLGAVLAGYGLLSLAGARHGSSMTMPWSVAMLGVAIAVAVGIVSGVLPARRAARLDPVQTLRLGASGVFTRAILPRKFSPVRRESSVSGSF
ncbi:MAG TPA: ABC transporter permease, partial [Gemmatimonadaceae bacterium]|nr:ABC transporter permease [Gemmatimonadaceae bacterium]